MCKTARILKRMWKGKKHTPDREEYCIQFKGWFRWYTYKVYESGWHGCGGYYTPKAFGTYAEAVAWLDKKFGDSYTLVTKGWEVV